MLDRYSRKALLRRALNAEERVRELEREASPIFRKARRRRIKETLDLRSSEDAKVWRFLEWVADSDMENKAYIIGRARLRQNRIRLVFDGKDVNEGDFARVAWLIGTGKEWAI